LFKKLENLKNNFHALSHRDFRIFWFGQIISLIGTWMQSIALPWLAYTITQSPFLLGLVGALQFMPMMFFSLFAGVLIDKFDKKKILILTQSILSICALILSVLVFTNHIRYWHILVVALCIGFANTFDMPSRQSFIIEMVGREDLMNAIGLNSAVFNMARIIGPSIAGIAMQFLGISFCFLVNSLSFVPVIIGLFFINLPYGSGRRKSENHIFKDIALGLKYIRSEKVLFWTLAFVFVMGTFAMNFNVLVPVYAKTVFNMGEAGFGFLMASMGVGSFIGSIAVAVKSKKGPKTLVFAVASIGSALGFFLMSISNNYFLSAFFLAVTGFANVTFFTTANSTLQLNSRDEYRGRVVSTYTLLFAGSTPLGNLFTGSVCGKFGGRAGFGISAAIIFVLMGILLFFNRSRRKV
jgi:MFS family permease